MNLIIVESPTKARTISKFLGQNYKIESSFGHVRDLPEKEMGVDIASNFAPKYVIPAKARKTIAKLKDVAQKADEIILAPDEDREGEAIAWHLAEALNLDQNKIKRIVFHEITKDAILAALTHPRPIDMKLVDAQQARRILDRLVGYELSPFLWKKVAKGLSAGRVQSVAVRLIVEREREIQAFKTTAYWGIEADLQKQKTELNFLAKLNKINNKTVAKLEIKNKEQADKILAELKGTKYVVADIEQKQTKKNPPSPFTTSTLQQTANRWLGFSARQTMLVAQQLYEMGYITYMRTDSLNLSDKFLNDSQIYLKMNLGQAYCLAKPRRFKTKSKGAQEAHEAIRPAEINNEPEALKNKLKNDQYKLYKLIWQRALAGQMPEALLDATIIDVDAVPTQSHASQQYQFRATGQVLKFAGYLKIYPEKSQEIELPEVAKEEELKLIKLNADEHFTKPPARYSDAGLVKTLEKYGIGRPSTYAPTIATIITRHYVARDEKKKLAPTDIAFIVIDLLVEHFSQIVDYQFTAQMENDLDNIAAGAIEWSPIIRDFYQPFHNNLEEKYSELNKEDIVPEEKSEEVCDKCSAPMIIKTGRYGKFLACSAYPNCKNIKSMPGTDRDKNGQDDSQEIAGLKAKYDNKTCEKCGQAMAVKVGKFGPFLACTGYPKCKNIKNIKENNKSTGIKCPKCGQGEIIEKRSRKGIFYACDQYPDCKTAFWSKPTGEKCPDCQSLLVELKKGVKCSNKECGYKK